MKTYLDFDLLIERAGDGYRAQVIQSPAGQASAEFKLPLSRTEVENFTLRLGRSKGATRRKESSEMVAAKKFGSTLFGAAFAGEVRSCLRASKDEASQKGLGLRVRLRLASVPELADLPWEYLYDPALNRFLSLSTETPIVRYLDLPERVRPLTVKPPIRIIAMVASPKDFEQLDVEREYENLSKALSDLAGQGRVVLERLAEPTLAGLQRCLRRTEYHVFHFIGHGGFDRQTEDGVLFFEAEDGRGRQVGSQYLGALLHDERSLRLAILNACEGAQAASCDPFSGTAQSLVQQGVPAVIAMQFEISDEAAITFSHEFYSSLAMGYPVDAALAEARKAIFAQVNEVEWGTPVLYMRAPDGCIFNVQEISEEERQQARILALRREVGVAMAEEDWALAAQLSQSLLELDPGDMEAQQALRQAREQKEAGALLSAAQEHERAGRLREALESYRRVGEKRGSSKDIEARISALEAQLARPEPPSLPPLPPLPPVVPSRTVSPPAGSQPQPGPAPPLPSQAGRSSKFLFAGLGCLILLGILLGSMALLVSQNDGSFEETEVFPAPTGEPVFPPPSEPDVKESLVVALDRSEVVQLEVTRTLDTSKLSTILTGEELRKALAGAESLARQGIYLAAMPAGKEIRSYSLSPDGARAEVEVFVKTSGMRLLSRETNECMARIPPFEGTSTVFMERGPMNWLVSAVQMRHAIPEPVSCAPGQ